MGVAPELAGRAVGEVFTSRIGRRVLLGFVCCALVPLGVLALLALTSVSSRLQTEADQSLRDVAKASGLSIAERLALFESDLELLVQSYRSHRFGLLDELPRGVRQRIDRHFTALAWLPADGDTSRARSLAGAVPVRDAGWSRGEREHLAAGRTLVGADARGVVRMQRRIEPGDATAGVLAAVVDGASLWHAELVERRGGGLCVVDNRAGRPLFTGGLGAVPERVSRQVAVHDGAGSRIGWQDAEGMRWSARPWRLFLVPRFGIDWSIVHARPSTELLGPLREFQWLFASTAAMAFLLVLVVGMVQIRRTLAPIARLRDATLRVAGGDLDGEVGIAGDDEFAQLGRSFDEMARRLRANIRRRERTEAELVEARDAAVAAARTEADFLTNVSHEFRTPLTGILSSAEILQQFIDEDAEVRLEFTETVLDQARQLARMIDDVIEVGQLRSQDAAVQREPVGVEESLTDALALIAPPRQRARVRVEATQPDLAVLGDRRRLAVAWFQLLDNALKFSPTDCEVTVRVAQSGGSVVVEFEDRGPGIDPAHRERIFERFRQVGRDLMTEKVGGTGLGLAIVREVVDLHGGRVEVEDASGGGSTFRITLAPAPDPALVD